MGIGYAYGSGKVNGKEGTFIYVVAKYLPTPNIKNQFLSNIEQPTSTSQ